VFKQQTLRYGLGLLVTFILFANASGLAPLRFIDTLEKLSYDFRLKLSLPSEIDKKVVIIDIDEKSLSAIGQWPWERNVSAAIVDKLFNDYNIKVLGFDILFAEKDEGPGDYILSVLSQSTVSGNEEFQKIIDSNQLLMHRDKRLGKSLASRNTVLGFIFSHSAENLAFQFY